jgi:multiple sugar transport system permease protein
LWGVILITVFGVNITNIYLIRGYVLSLPYEIEEAAIIDGCSFFMVFVKVVAPLLKPIIATVAILSFKHSWNNYLMPMVFTLSNPGSRPLVVGIVSLKSTGEAAASWNLMMAGTTISLVPILVVFLFFNRYFIGGMSSGAVKG